MWRTLPIPHPHHPSVPRTVPALMRDMIRPFRWQVIGFFTITLVGAVAWAAAPLMVARIVTDLSYTRAITPAVIWLIVLYGVMGLLNECCWRFGELLLRQAKPQMVESVRWRLFAAVLRRPYSFFVNASSGQIGHWINQVTETTNSFIDLTVWNVWNQAIALVVSAGFLLTTHWSLALIFVIWLVALFAYNLRRGKPFARLVAVTSDEQSKAAGQVVDALANHVSVRAFGGEAMEHHLLAARQQHIVHHWRRSWMQNIFTSFVKGQSIAYVTTLALVMVILLYAHGIIPIGAIVLFIAYFGDASTGLWELAWALDSYYRNIGSIQNALDGLQGVDERRVEDATAPAHTNASVELRFDNVSFVYPDQPDAPVLDHLSLTVAPGERVGIVGPSGAGKSTLVGLLLGFFEPHEGVISLNGHTTAEYGPQLIRSCSSYVPQDTNLFNRTIRENVLYAKPRASDAEVIAALAKAQAMEFVSKLPHGLDSVIGERGVKLSGGQRQRIAIARAILQGAPLLILDEATSALDSISEQAIQQALFELMQHRTAIVVAHRLSTLKNLDRIVVIDQGKIVEHGTHEQLVRQAGLYADMWKRQKNGFVVG